ncbi:MAG: DUF1778 domain-containing protein [Polaromonas sp.]|nr:DUF1778 domain-containing protein [Polaromonas sp.]
MRKKALKNARLELKTTRETKELFRLASAIEIARSILRDHAAITLSAEGQLQLARLLQTQPEPTEAMKALRQQPRLKVRAE